MGKGTTGLLLPEVARSTALQHLGMVQHVPHTHVALAEPQQAPCLSAGLSWAKQPHSGTQDQQGIALLLSLQTKLSLRKRCSCCVIGYKLQNKLCDWEENKPEHFLPTAS